MTLRSSQLGEGVAPTSSIVHPTPAITPAFPRPVYVPALLYLGAALLAPCGVILGLLIAAPGSTRSVLGLGAGVMAAMLLLAALLTVLAGSLVRARREHVYGRGFATRLFDMSVQLGAAQRSDGPVVARLGVVQRWSPFARMHSVYAEVLTETSELTAAWFYADSRGRSIGSHGERIAPRLTGSPSGDLVQVAHVRGVLRIAVHGSRAARPANAIWACRILEELLSTSRDEPARGFRDTGMGEQADELEALARRLDVRATDGSSAWTRFDGLIRVWLAEDPVTPPDPRGLPPPVDRARSPRQPPTATPPLRYRWHIPPKLIAIGLFATVAVILAVPKVVYELNGRKKTVVKAADRPRRHWTDAVFILGIPTAALMLLAAELLQRVHMVSEGPIGKTRRWMSRIHRFSVSLSREARFRVPEIAEFTVLRRWKWTKALHSLYASVPAHAVEFHVDNRGISRGNAAGLVANLLVGARAPRGGLLREPHILLASSGTSVFLAIHGGLTDRAEIDFACAVLEEALHRLRAQVSGHMARPLFTSERDKLDRLERRLRPPVAVSEARDELAEFVAERRSWDSEDAQDRARRAKGEGSNGR